MKCCNSKSRVRNLKSIVKWNPMHDFDFFFKLFSISFLFFGIYKKDPCKQKLLRIIEIIADIILFYCLLIPFRVYKDKGASAIYSLSALASVLFLLLIRVWFFRKRDEIVSVAEEISKLYKVISEDTYENTNNTRKWIILLYIFCIIVSVFLSLIQIYQHFVGDQGMLYINVISSDLNILSLNNKIFQQILALCIIFNNYIAFMTYLLSLMFCCIFYEILQKLLIVFGQKLSEDKKFLLETNGDIRYLNTFHESPLTNKHMVSNSGHEICDLLMKNIDYFNSLKTIATKIDNITSLVAVSLISLAITALFETRSISILAISNTESENAFSMLELTTFSFAFLVVTSLSFCASNVTSSFEETVQIIRLFTRKLSGSIRSPKTNEGVLLLMLVNNSNTTEIYMTGWGMFKLNKSLVLTIAGVMITYGVIINQMVAEKISISSKP